MILQSCLVDALIIRICAGHAPGAVPLASSLHAPEVSAAVAAATPVERAASVIIDHHRARLPVSVVAFPS